jgi:hypothetical protein
MKGRRIGIDSASRIEPNSPPTMEDEKDAPKGPPGLAAFRHGMAVEHGRRRPDRARNPEQDRRNGIRGCGDGPHADQEGEGRMRVHGMGERNEQGHAGKAANAGHHADDEPEQDAGENDGKTRWIEHDGEGTERVVKKHGGSVVS